jgi:CBS domain-containing protein
MNVICCEADKVISEVAALMRRHHVGDVIIVDDTQNGQRVPIGIVTDRDIVIETIALDVDAKLFTASDLMMAPVVTVQEDASLTEALSIMRSKKVRRLPVVTRSGSLFGIITTDDLINLLASELSMIAGLTVEQTLREGKLRK